MPINRSIQPIHKRIKFHNFRLVEMEIDVKLKIPGVFIVNMKKKKKFYIEKLVEFLKEKKNE